MKDIRTRLLAIPAWRLVPMAIALSVALAACAAPPAPTAAPPPPTTAPAKPAPTAPPQAKAAETQPAKAAPAATAAPKPAPRVTLKSAFTTTAAQMAPIWAAAEGGFFEAEGLDVSLTRIQAGAPVLAAIRSGEVPIAFVGGQQIVEANLQGGDYVILAGFFNNMAQQVYAHPSIERPEQLKGKAVGVTNFGAITHVAIRTALKYWGIDEKEVTVLATGGPPETIAAMQGGRIHAAAFSPPEAFQARDQGFRMLLDMAKIDAPLLSTSAATTVKWAKENPDLVDRYLRAVIKATHRLKTDKEFGVRAIMKYTGQQDRNIVAETYDYFRDQWSRDGSPSLEGAKAHIELAAEQIPEAKNAKPEQFVDPSFVQKIKASGLIDQLWGKS